jgi:pimeloyl-ACP methyl ester carboxylesterase
MLQAIKNRELIALDCLGSPILGTLHRPPERSFGPRAAGNAPIPGILFLNSLSLPRAATGDSAVHWADSCAEWGYPSFRLDLPGLGDSAADISMDLLDFINSGGYESIAASIVKELVQRMGLSGVVIIGHCAGSVSALFAAAACKECKGLILMDPYFHLPQMIRPTARRKLSEWARSSRIGAAASDIYDRWSDLLLLVRGERPPGNANFRLLKCWKQVTTTGMPVLLLKAPGLKASGTKPRRGQFDYLKHVMKLAGKKEQVTIKLIEGTDHSFANRTGRAAVRLQIGSWLETYFPLSGSEENAQKAIPPSRARDHRSDAKPQRVSTHVGCAAEGR